MLEEGIRRQSRGADVVIGVVDTKGRPPIVCRVEQLASVAPGPVASSTGSVEMNVDAVVKRQPAVALVDEMAHRVDGDPDHPRWHDIETLRDAGIDVITTVSAEHLDSLKDVVTSITGIVPTDSVPDSVVLAADQIELVDMSPEALRRRMAHGNIYPPERVDAALANYFRPGNLAALRQLALLWVADHVEARLQDYVASHNITETWDVRERVVVGLTGTNGDVLVRRASRIASRSRGQLIGVHVTTRSSPGPDLEEQRRLLVALGGTYREIVGDDVADALTRFTQVEHATQLVLGAGAPSSRGLLGRRRSVVAAMLERVGDVDIHVISNDVGDGPPADDRRTRQPRRQKMPKRLRQWAWLVCLVGLPLLTFVLTRLRGHVSVGSALLLDLTVVIAVAAMGGVVPGIVASVLAFALTLWFLTPPLHTLEVRDSENIVALSVFITVTFVVSLLVDRAARRSREAARARAEAGALARSAATLVGAHDPLPELLEQLRATFALDAAAVLEQDDQGWWPTVSVGDHPLLRPEDGDAIDLAGDSSVQLVVSPGALGPDQLEVLRAFADQLSVALQGRQLRAEAAQADVLAETNALRAALLQAVSHDLRTPLASIKASATGLLQTEVSFSDEDRRDLLANIDHAADRLSQMVRNLLDMSRLQAGAVVLSTGAVALEEVVAAALADVPQERVVVDVSDSLPLVLADAALLERALGNIVSNAVAWSPPDRPVRVEAGQIGEHIDLRVIDRGPGVPMALRESMFVPFQRLGDRSNDAGAGLGLAIAKGFIEAMGSSLDVEDTPGGGLTISIRLRTAGLEGEG
jgi:two-component system, OmpR family, sensor histidine kinase KdpD